MKKLSLILALSVAVFAGCDFLGIGYIQGSDNIITMDVGNPPTNFTSVSVATSIHATIVPSTEYKLEITANDNLIEYIRLENEYGCLSIGLNSFLATFGNVQISATISMPTLAMVDASTSSVVEIEDFGVLPSLSVMASTSASLSGPVTLSGLLDVDASTSASVVLTGSAAAVRLNASTSAVADLRNVIAASAQIDASTSAFCYVNAASIDVEASTSAMVYYVGNPVITGGKPSTSAQVLKL